MSHPARAGRLLTQSPLAMSLTDALREIDKTFGIDAILADQGRNIVQPYYAQSRFGFRWLYSDKGCMHLALNPEGTFTADGFRAQSREMSAQIRALHAAKVLELGCGMGFNILALAPDHPDVEFTGLDLSHNHVRDATSDAAGQGNVTFRQGSFEAVLQDLYGVELIFAIETLCHASDIDAVAGHVAAALKPGGRFVLYDAFRKPDFDDAPAEVITAARLLEITTAVTDGFWRLDAWCAALERAGLVIARADDITRDAGPGIRRLHSRAAKFFRSWKYRVLRFVMPKYLIRNAVAGLAGPFAFEGAAGGDDTPRACLTYNIVVAQKPAE